MAGTWSNTGYESDFRLKYAHSENHCPGMDQSVCSYLCKDGFCYPCFLGYRLTGSERRSRKTGSMDDLWGCLILYTSPVNIAIIAAMTPLAVMLIAALILKEPVTFKKAAGVLIGASGALLIIFQSSAINTDSSGNWIGNLLCIVNVITYAIYLVITRPISQRYSAITLMKWMFLFSALISFPPGISDLPEAKVFGTESNPFVILKLSYIVIMATGIAYFLVPMALKRIRPTTASMYNNLQPIIASIIAILIGQDVFSWDKPIAALLVFTGVYLVTQSKAKEEVKGIK